MRFSSEAPQAGARSQWYGLQSEFFSGLLMLRPTAIPVVNKKAFPIHVISVFTNSGRWPRSAATLAVAAASWLHDRLGSKSAVLILHRSLPVHPDKQTF